MELKRVVVTGLGAITPLGNDVDTTWQAALRGESGAGPITHFDASKFKTQFACEVKNFKGEDHFDRKKLRQLDLYAQYALVAARQAVADAKLVPASEDESDCSVNRNRVGVIVAAGIGGLHTFEEEAGYYAVNGEEMGPKFNPFFIPKMIADIASGHISMEYGFHGPNYGTVSACASSNHAIIDAYNLIRLGKADAIVTGGAEAAIFPAGVGGFNSMHALSTRNDEPTKASRPFSASRDGFVMGEGSAVLVLEEMEHALARGAKIYAEIAGGGMSADAHHLTATHPEGLGAILSMQNALDDAEMKPEEIDYINTHGTSTPVGDLSEIKAICGVFGDHASKLNISSTKSMTGHLLGATGALEAIFSIKAVENDIVPPTINHADDDVEPEIPANLNLTFNQAQKRTVNAALSNVFGFGGHNATIIVKKFKA
jgi:3-oxoacyl-[acyl-carrier-protein] synthase II